MFTKSMGWALALATLAAACGKDKTSYPLLTPPVKAATPSGLQGGSSTGQALMRAPVHEFALDMNDFQSRFFTDGPTNLFNILASIDNRINGLNSQGTNSDCIKQKPVAVPITIFGESLTFQFQCYQTLTPGFPGDPGLIEWGQDSNGIFYLYDANGAGWTAATATPLADANSISDASERYVVHAWSSVGIGNGQSSSSSSNNNGTCGTAWNNCSYGVIEIHADPSKPLFEMAVAGTGIGYCGAQIVSDGNTIFGVGSPGQPCSSTDTVCVQAASTNTAATTCTVGNANFTLPALGTVQDGNIQASAYPGNGNNQIVLTGNANDSVHFGPTTAAAGVNKF